MYFKYGTYQHPFGECMVSEYSATRMYHRRGRAYILRRRMTVVGEIIADTPSLISSRVREIKYVYSFDGGDAVLQDANMNSTAIFLSSLTSITGVRVVEGPNFPQAENQAHFVTGLPFNVTLEADYLIQSGGLMEFKETLRKVGNGGPRRIVIEVDSGPPVVQYTTTHTPVKIMQEGRAVGIGEYPVPGAPLFPDAVDYPDGCSVEEESPTLYGNSYLAYPVSWAYTMTLPQDVAMRHPLTGEGR